MSAKTDLAHLAHDLRAVRPDRPLTDDEMDALDYARACEIEGRDEPESWPTYDDEEDDS